MPVPLVNTMRALRFHGKQDIRLDEVNEPICAPGWVKVKNSWCGICGTDLHEYADGPHLIPTEAHAITGESLPCTLGWLPFASASKGALAQLQID